MIFNAQEVLKAEELDMEFCHRCEGVVNLIFGDRLRIEGHGTSTVDRDGNQIIHYYWNGDEDEPYDNRSVVFPFEWVNKSFEELKEIKPKYWEEVERLNKEKEERMKREQAEAERIKALESKEYQIYLNLKKKFEKYEQTETRQ